MPDQRGILHEIGAIARLTATRVLDLDPRAALDLIAGLAEEALRYPDTLRVTMPADFEGTATIGFYGAHPQTPPYDWRTDPGALPGGIDLARVKRFHRE